MHRQAALQIWEGKSALTIPSVSGADQIKEGVIFANGNLCAVAERPTRRSEITPKQANLSNKRT
jgi:hypothetical protein